MKPAIRFEHPLVEGYNFRRMAVSETNGTYRFQLTRDYAFIYGFDILPGNLHEVSYRDYQGREWVRMTKRTKIVRLGYAWNGNSYKKGVRLFGRDIWLGTPDFHPGGTLEASLGHDPDYQFAHTEHFPFSFPETNVHYCIVATQAGCNKLICEIIHGVLDDFGKAAWNSSLNNPVHSIAL